MDMPENCDKCGMLTFYERKPYCVAMNNVIYCDLQSGRAAGCPLKPLPEKRSDAFVYTNVDGYKTVRENPFVSGWNECIDRILGGTAKCTESAK